MRCPAILVLALGSGCTQDSAFTKLSDPEPPARDTSVPPVELVDTGTPPPPECPDAGLVSAAPVARDDTCTLAHTTIPLNIEEEWSTATHWSSTEDPFPYINSHPSIGDMTEDDQHQMCRSLKQSRLLNSTPPCLRSQTRCGLSFPNC